MQDRAGVDGTFGCAHGGFVVSGGIHKSKSVSPMSLSKSGKPSFKLFFSVLQREAFFRKIKHRQDCVCFSSCMYACCCELKICMNFFLCNLPFTLPGSSWNVVNFLMCTLV